jgi:hypothetical protein
MAYLCNFKHVDMIEIFANYNFICITDMFYEIQGREITVR